jgi:hypothetical protein
MNSQLRKLDNWFLFNNVEKSIKAQWRFDALQKTNAKETIFSSKKSLFVFFLFRELVIFEILALWTQLLQLTSSSTRLRLM